MIITIGKLAKLADVTVETIRYYQRIGLLDEPEKPDSGYRCYLPDSIARIRFIKRAQQSGFSLKEITELIALNSGHCDDVRKIAEQKLLRINQQISTLIILRNELNQLVKGCRTGVSTERCSLIDTLANNASDSKTEE
ncbi:MAG: MerR family transcriptional regulator [Methylobacter sp.]|nr:MerR family transcriptional regulator [Methylobacter sp.]